MRKAVPVSDFRLIGGLLVAGVVFVACALQLISYFVDHWIARDAQMESRMWAEGLSEKLTDLEAIANASEPSAQSLEVIRLAGTMGRVFRFKIFGDDGRLRLVVDDQGRIETEGADLATHNPQAAAVFQTGTPFTQVFDDRKPGRPDVYAETYLPIVRDGRIAAVVEVYVDQSETATRFRHDLTLAGLLLSALLALAFSIPYTAFVVRSQGKRVADARADFHARHDGLTGVLNRAAFMDRLEETVRTAAADGEAIALHVIDIDRFKAVNDELGPEEGDALIRLVAMRASEMIRPYDFIGRFGGDEFVIAQCGILCQRQAESMAQRLVRRLSETYAVEDRDVPISVSIGCALMPADATSARELVKKAGFALSFVKNTGRNGFSFFRDTMEEELVRRRELERLVRLASRDRNFLLHFQPIMCVAEGRITGFEALLRLPDDTGEMVPPTEFIPVAEDLGLLPTIGGWVIRKACQSATSWPDDLSIAINLSPSQFAAGNLAEFVARTLEETGLAPGRLELEITESLLLDDSDSVLRQLNDLKALGVSIVMDDFGTGYSSLSYLWRFPFDKIKIDRSFMDGYAQSAETIQKILSTIIALGRALNMRVTIEGVETLLQARAIEGLAVDHLQGYLFGRPQAEIEIPGNLLKDFLRTVDGLKDKGGSAEALAAFTAPRSA
ncbi:putative bifunctional diguanylate cyclase/phosphodiesterase [Polymorphum gilvum]|uniref:Diguanylate cyclase/phosphodiesterase with PAS/PAC sensor(S) n=1 Tax=Polymorphum gilvum (strain LMG 25793 / CGMCC 1.9160 / SL003B-26A1) TaxID=991905 RepID=F2J0B5_POLGS|nr:bifunctional diguanylate cyclase/phosphodiesterase [Polymorphum gilvum]ADZ68650.1 Diguanylate cyclase/phosphodiesterase with PAS/PAC sensor(S) [Polymorphum gilvum SL003B-26A1]